MKTLLLIAILAGGGLLTDSSNARAAEPYRAPGPLAQPWHCDYYNTQWGSPVALLVPPTARKHREMGWGVGDSRVRRIRYQFDRPYPGETFGPSRPFLSTPAWPSDTTQFGVYYVRGPW